MVGCTARRQAWWLLGLLAALLPARAQLQVVDPVKAYEEIRLLRRLTSLGLTRPQTEQIAAILPKVQQARQALEQLQARYYLETADGAGLFENALLRAEPPNPQLSATLQAAADRYATARQTLEKTMYDAMNGIWALLQPAQKALVETDAAAETRRASERLAQANKDAALKLALGDCTWVRNATDEAFRVGAAQHAIAVAQAARPTADATMLAALAQQVAGFYTGVRRMSPTQYVAVQAQLPDQLRGVLAPPAPPTATQISASDWVAMWQDARVAALLAQLSAALPAGAAR